MISHPIPNLFYQGIFNPIYCLVDHPNHCSAEERPLHFGELLWQSFLQPFRFCLCYVVVAGSGSGISNGDDGMCPRIIKCNTSKHIPHLVTRSETKSIRLYELQTVGWSPKGKLILNVGPSLQSFFSLSISHSVCPCLTYPCFLSSPLHQLISPLPTTCPHTPLHLMHSLF